VKARQQRVYYKRLEFRNALCSYFTAIIAHDEKMQRKANQSIPPKYINEKFKPTFFEFCRLVNHVEAGRFSHKLKVRSLSKLLNDFSETLISSGSVALNELSACWVEGGLSDSTIKAHSERLKRMGATVLSEIVEHAAGLGQEPHRSGSRSTSHRPAASPSPLS
jgi:hypothetical protein